MHSPVFRELLIMRKELVSAAGFISLCVAIGSLAGCQNGSAGRNEITDPNAAFSRSATKSNTGQESSAGGRQGGGFRGVGNSVGAGD